MTDPTPCNPAPESDPMQSIAQPTALERIRPLIESGQIHACTRSGKPLTEGDAAVLLEFHDHLASLPPKENP